MKWMMLIVLAAIATACGGSAASSAHARTGPDVVTAEWTSGDDAVLEAQD